MSSKQSSDLMPFVLLNFMMKDDFRKEIVKRALQFQSKTTTATKHRFNKALRNTIQIKGYRNPTLAPISVRVNAVTHEMQRSNLLMGAVLATWVESQADLHTLMRDFLTNREIPLVDFNNLVEGFEIIENFTDKRGVINVFDLADAFKIKIAHSRYNLDNIFLMICCLTGKIVRSVANRELSETDEINNQTHQGETSMIWKQWLTELKDLPASAPEWDHLSKFLDTVKQIADEKHKERETRQLLHQVLDRLREASYVEEIDYFHLSCEPWAAEACPLTETEAIAEQVNEFASLLQQNAELRHQTCQTRTEDSQRFKALDDLWERIQPLHDTLTLTLTQIKEEVPKVSSIEETDSPDRDEPIDESHSIESDNTEETFDAPPQLDAAPERLHESTEHLSGAESILESDETTEEISVETTDLPNQDEVESQAGDNEEIITQDEEIGGTTEVSSLLDGVPEKRDESTEFVSVMEDVVEPKEMEEEAPAEAIDSPAKGEEKVESHATAGEKIVPEAEETDEIVEIQPQSDTVTEKLDQPAESPSDVEPEVTKVTLYPESADPDDVPHPPPMAEAEDGTTASKSVEETPNTSQKIDAAAEELNKPPSRGRTKPKSKKRKEKAGAKSEDTLELPSEPRPIYALTGPPHEAALSITRDNTQENWDAFLYTLIATDHLSSAYWLVRSADASKRDSPIPSWLLAVVQAARGLWPHSKNFSNELLDIVENHQPGSNEVQQLLGGAAVLHSALIAPTSGTIVWLSGLELFPSFRDLVAPILDFANLGKALQPTDLMEAKGREKLEASINEAVIGARLWLDRVPSSHANFKRASNVLLYFGSPQSILYNLLYPVSNDQRDKAKEVRHQLSMLGSQNKILKYIHEVDQKRVGYKYRRPIDGSYLRKIVRDVEAAKSIAKRWCNTVEHEHEIQTEGNWLSERAEEMRDKVQNFLPDVEVALDELYPPEQALSATTAAASCFRKTLGQLRDILCLTSEESEQLINPADFLFVDENDLIGGPTGALNHFLLWLPEISLDDDAQPLAEELPKIAEVLCSAYAEERTLRKAIEGWLANQDYRFVGVQRRAFGEESERVELNDIIQEKRHESRVTLEGEVSKTMTAVEQAIVDGIITEVERSSYSAIIDGITDDLENIKIFPPKFQELKNVQNHIATIRSERLDHLKSLWQQLQPQLAVTCSDLTQRRQIIRLVEEAFENRDTRIVDECIANLRESIETGEVFDLGWLTTDASVSRVHHVLEQFLKNHTRLEETITNGLSSIVTSLRHSELPEVFGSLRLPRGRLEEALKAFEAWLRLKNNPGKPNLANLEILLQYLGFELSSSSALRSRDKGSDYLYVQAQMTYNGDLPVPQFGSQMDGNYDIVCLWERPGMEKIDAHLHTFRLNSRNVFIFYLGRLVVRQQAELRRMMVDNELALAVLDETLLLFLAGEFDVRLPVFLRCTLPFAAINPYTPFQAGDVPPEMFFGRERMARELMRPGGTCLVYGGRQLGKSALLRDVQRKFHYPEEGNYAWVEDIKLVGDPTGDQPTDAIWWRLREAFKQLELIPLWVTTDKSSEIARCIREAFQTKNCRVLFMFDEADNFLDADSKGSFRIVEALRTLMMNTQRRFKVVFTGLHNVQRFQGIPNQPLAHFGAPLCVGPLEPSAAQKLVRQPLEGLGYRFANDATVLRILSYTNYHPGLIQLFCQELIRRFHQRMANDFPPYTITPEDVEAIYLIQDVRNQIRERFDWTLALDDRYQAIAWAMILDQIDIKDSYAQAYSTAEILKLVRSWWARGFAETGTDLFQGLLEEMKGLGVLVCNRDKYYRLRSPNLVRLMGTDADIEGRLEELMEKEPKVAYEADSHHIPLDNDAQRYSPLTHEQERLLSPPQFGVGLVFASEALRLSSMPDAFRRFIPSDIPDDVLTECAEIPADIESNASMKQWFREFLEERETHNRLVVYQRVSGSGESMESRIKAAWQFCRERPQSRRRWLRILFLFDPQATWKWLCLPRDRREDSENRVDAVTFPRRWNETGVRQRIEQHDMICTSEVVQAVLQSTGGWPMLLDVLFDRSKDKDHSDPRLSAKNTVEELMSSNTQLHQDFTEALGIKDNPLIFRILTFIHESDCVPPELMTTDLIEGEPPVSQEEFEATVEFLQSMGCVEQTDEGFQVEPIVQRVLWQQ